jgi:hypothetical protein
MARLEGKIALVTGGNSGIWPCDGEAVREQGRVRLHHGTP